MSSCASWGWGRLGALAHPFSLGYLAGLGGLDQEGMGFQSGPGFRAPSLAWGAMRQLTFGGLFLEGALDRCWDAEKRWEEAHGAWLG